MDSDVAPTSRVRAAPAILNAGAVAGAMDIAAATLQAWIAGRSPVRMLQGIAWGWFGRASLKLGWTSAAIGFVTHFLIATSWAAIYWFASRRLKVLVRHAWWSGAVFAVFVYGVMHQIVMPLSAIHRRVPQTPQQVLIGLMIHVTCVGLPIALIVRAHTPRREITDV
jgi:uncharacterized membrane protein YagU involved in acid resistance